MRASFCLGVLLGWAEGYDEVGALRVARVADVVVVACAHQTEVARIHLAGDTINGQFAVALLHEPYLVVFVGVVWLMQCANFLDGFVTFELNVAGCQHAEQVAVGFAFG